LEEARDRLLAAGDVEGAAEALITLSEHYWITGDSDPAMASLEEARRLVEAGEPSPAKARAASQASRLLMLAARDVESVAVGEEALAMAEQLGLEEIRAATL